MPLFDVFWAMLWLFIWIAWIWLVVSIFFDLFRSHDLGGWAKALWALFILVLPILGVLVYLIVRGGDMHERAAADMVKRQQAMDDYVKNVAGSGGGVADELTKLGQLRDQGVISDDEFQAQKTKLLA